MNKILNIGAGPREATIDIPSGWTETRLDIDPAAEPDIVADARDLSMIPDASYDVVYASHVIEHVYAYEVEPMVAEWHRVLVPHGTIRILTPDLLSVFEMVVRGGVRADHT